MQFNLQIRDLANFTLTQTIQRLLILWSNHIIWRRLMREKLTSLRRSMGVFFRSRKRFGSVFIEREFNNELKQSQTTAWRIRKKRGPPFVRDDVKYQTYCTVWFNLIGCVCLYNTYNRKMHWFQLFFFLIKTFVLICEFIYENDTLGHAMLTQPAHTTFTLIFPLRLFLLQ